MRNIIFEEMNTAYLWDDVYFSAEKKTYIYCGTISLEWRANNEKSFGESALTFRNLASYI